MKLPWENWYRGDLKGRDPLRDVRTVTQTDSRCDECDGYTYGHGTWNICWSDRGGPNKVHVVCNLNSKEEAIECYEYLFDATWPGRKDIGLGSWVSTCL